MVTVAALHNFLVTVGFVSPFVRCDTKDTVHTCVITSNAVIFGVFIVDPYILFDIFES